MAVDPSPTPRPWVAQALRRLAAKGLDPVPYEAVLDAFAERGEWPERRRATA
ncbi:hypothetical protein GCM10010211_50640 [Streptomyces albospinus]|uniref:Uncharacterized protein n=1 Tax=Streptomyces albospinus TaxID=285515 RepID=A0ABQ2VBN9_9ACTN|nr:hypothetical protein [Streptomyces albospinus]GGU78629.1 hypothetical protein GCM10010211_50640 [Streptomyces albospinus]